MFYAAFVEAVDEENEMFSVVFYKKKVKNISCSIRITVSMWGSNVLQGSYPNPNLLRSVVRSITSLTVHSIAVNLSDRK